MSITVDVGVEETKELSNPPDKRSMLSTDESRARASAIDKVQGEEPDIFILRSGLRLTVHRFTAIHIFGTDAKKEHRRNPVKLYNDIADLLQNDDGIVIRHLPPRGAVVDNNSVEMRRALLRCIEFTSRNFAVRQTAIRNHLVHATGAANHTISRDVQYTIHCLHRLHWELTQIRDDELRNRDPTEDEICELYRDLKVEMENEMGLIPDSYPFTHKLADVPRAHKDAAACISMAERRISSRCWDGEDDRLMDRQKAIHDVEFALYPLHASESEDDDDEDDAHANPSPSG